MFAFERKCWSVSRWKDAETSFGVLSGLHRGSFYLWDGFLIHIFSNGLLLGRMASDYRTRSTFSGSADQNRPQSLSTFLRLRCGSHLPWPVMKPQQGGQTVDNMYPLGSQNQHGVCEYIPCRHGYWPNPLGAFVLFFFFFYRKQIGKADTLLQFILKRSRQAEKKGLC